MLVKSKIEWSEYLFNACHSVCMVCVCDVRFEWDRQAIIPKRLMWIEQMTAKKIIKSNGNVERKDDDDDEVEWDKRNWQLNKVFDILAAKRNTIFHLAFSFASNHFHRLWRRTSDVESITLTIHSNELNDDNYIRWKRQNVFQTMATNIERFDFSLISFFLVVKWSKSSKPRISIWIAVN